MLPDNSTSPWLAGIRLDSFEGDSLGVQIANAADAIDADILSPADVAYEHVLDPASPKYVPFTTKAMVERSHELGRLVKPWTVCVPSFLCRKSVLIDITGESIQHRRATIGLEGGWNYHGLFEHVAETGSATESSDSAEVSQKEGIAMSKSTHRNRLIY